MHVTECAYTCRHTSYALFQGTKIDQNPTFEALRKITVFLAVYQNKAD